MAAIAAALVVPDYRTNGRLSFASKVGGTIVFGQLLLHVPVTRAETFAEVASFLQPRLLPLSLFRATQREMRDGNHV